MDAIVDDVVKTVAAISGAGVVGPHMPLIQAGLDSLGAHFDPYYNSYMLTSLSRYSIFITQS